MKRLYLIYLLVGLIGLFLIIVGLMTWQNRENQTTINTTSIKTSKTETPPITYPKATTYNVPILMYHYIRVAPEGDTLGQGLSVTPENFALQMAWLKTENYASVKVSDLTDPDKKEISKILAEGQKPIAITFDDGYEDAFTAAYPVLKKDGFTGTFYIIRNFVGRSEYMNQTQIDELSSAGMEIGSHSLDHPNLEKLSIDNQKKQIFDSKNSAATFCYPAGKYNNDTVALVKEAGYLTAVTTKSGIANQDSNLFELPRVRIKNGDAKYLKDQLIK